LVLFYIIIEVLIGRFNFSIIYFQDLIDELKSELGGDMENIVVAMLLPIDVFYARELDKAMKVSIMGSGRRSWGEGGLPWVPMKVLRTCEGRSGKKF
jgi:hypothetical protein